MASRRKRGYSRAFRPNSTTTPARYLLDDIPRRLWTDSVAKARREGFSMRALILTLLKLWRDGVIRIPTSERR